MINNIQALRALAAFLVVWAHVQGFFPAYQRPAYLPSGLEGVDLFFVISGFIMVRSTTMKPTGPATFFAHRLVRVLPIYYITTAVTVLIAIVAPAIFHSTTVDGAALVKSVLFIPYEKTFNKVYPLYYVGWTLNYEMFFYLVFAIAMAISFTHRALITGAAIVALTIVGMFVVDLRYGAVLYAFTRTIMLDFCLGMVIAAQMANVGPAGRRAVGWPRALWSCALLVGVAGLVAIRLMTDAQPEPIDPPTATFVTYGIPSALIVAAAVALEGMGISVRNKTLLALGAASYSLYMTHYFVVGFLIAVANRINAGETLRIALAIAAVPAVSIVALLTCRLVESPLAALFRGKRRSLAV